MMGPLRQLDGILGSKKERILWLKSMSVEVLDQNGKLASLEYLCHAWAGFPQEESDWERITISQGLGEIRFPEGYGLKFLNTKVHLLAQELNDTPGKIDKRIQYRFTFRYLSDVAAKKLKLRTLQSDTFNVRVPESEVDHGAIPTPPQDRGIHFYVPPGRHEYHQALVKQPALANTRIHFIKVHLHPYGESVELFDKTAKKSVWKGLAQMDPKRPVILSVESYSSSEGLRVYSDHEYEVIGVYNNTTDHPVDAMALLRVQYAPL